MHQFPDGFSGGAATAAYQIEGAHDADGKGAVDLGHVRAPARQGRTTASTGDVACDHYHRYRDDVALMAELGLNAYRFSVSWPRVIPARHRRAEPARASTSTTAWSTRCSSARITPFITLYHWDLPQALQDRGGWGNRDIAGWFGDYAALLGRTLGDRVKHWITFNEPFAFIVIGHVFGMHAPGLTDPALAFQASHHMNLAHGDAVRALRATRAGQPRSASPRCRCPPIRPATARPTAPRRWRFDGFVNRWYWEPSLLGRYPADVLERLGAAGADASSPATSSAWRRRSISSATTATRARSCATIPTSALVGATQIDTGNAKTAMGWEIYPDHLYDALTRITRDYGAPEIYITENGAAFDDAVVERRGRRPAAHRLPARPPRRLPARHRRRRQAARLLLLVAARQLRVGLRLLEALRPRLRRLPDPAADREGERAVVFGDGARGATDWVIVQ